MFAARTSVSNLPVFLLFIEQQVSNDGLNVTVQPVHKKNCMTLSLGGRKNALEHLASVVRKHIR